LRYGAREASYTLFFFLLFLLTFISPWSAICLADWQWGHRSKCDLQALNDPQGIYGRWNWSVISIYFIGLLMELPFVSSSIYTGPIAGLLDGADISWLVGLIGTGIVYYIYSRILPPLL
jgi:NCS1 family nucleobase:cation symporter-1